MKRILLSIIALLLLVTGCAVNQEYDKNEASEQELQDELSQITQIVEEDIEDNNTKEETILEEGPVIDPEIEKLFVEVIDNEPEAISQAFMNVVNNMSDYMAYKGGFDEDYSSYQYMLCDYNHDEIEEVVLMLPYRVDGIDYFDLAYLYYDVDFQNINILGIVHDEICDNVVYGIYQGEMARYVVDRAANKADIYAIIGSDHITYGKQASFDYIPFDIGEIGFEELVIY